MFYSLDSQNLKIPKRQSGKIISLLPLQNNYIIALDDSPSLMQYKIPSGLLKAFIMLPFKARRIIALNSNNLALLAPDQRTLYQIQVINNKIIPIHTFSIEQAHFNTHYLKQKQKEYFSTMQITPFNMAEACYLRQERAEERKIKLHFFTNKSNNQTNSSMKQNESKWTHYCHQQNMNGCYIEKMDQKSKLAFYKQQIQNNGQFGFITFDYLTKMETQVNVQSALFTVFTIVRAIKTSESNILVCLNHKNPVILYFNSNTQSSSKQVKTSLLWIINTQSFILNYCFSEQQKSSGRLQLRKPTGELMDNIETSYDEICVSKNGQLVLTYSRQRKDSGYVTFQAIRIIRKQVLYLNMLQQTHKTKYSNSFMREILSLL